MKALVLAGGSGTRLRPFSYSQPKQLIAVANRPVLDHVLTGIAARGITETGIVVGERADAIRTVVGDGSRYGLAVTYLRQDAPRGLAHAVRVARPFLGDEDFFMQLGDNLIDEGLDGIAACFRRDRPDADVVVQKMPDPRQFGVIELDAEGAPVRFVEKPRHPRSDLVAVGAYFFTAAVHEAVDAVAPRARGELEITDAVQWMIDHRSVVRASVFEGYWKDVGQIDDVLSCNRHLLARLTSGVAGHVDADSSIGDGVVVEPGARIVRSRLRGPAVVGPGSLIEDCDIGPFTSIGRDCVLTGTRISDSVVLDKARISGSMGLRRSLIGRHATVGGAGTGQDTRLIIGDHSHVGPGAADHPYEVRAAQS